MNSESKFKKNRLVEKITPDIGSVDEIIRSVREHFFSDIDDGQLRFKIEICIRESLLNAVIHGSIMSCGSIVVAVFKKSKSWFTIQVEDGGCGFDWKRKVQMEEYARNTAAENSRGIALLAKYSDKMRFNKDGNRIILKIKLGGYRD